MSVASLFIYGTLCDLRTRRKILGRAGLTVLAELPGFARVDGKWPYLVPCAGGKVSGRILKGLALRDWARLDDYEDVARGLYRRNVVNINGARCFIYLPDLKKWPRVWR